MSTTECDVAYLCLCYSQHVLNYFVCVCAWLATCTEFDGRVLEDDLKSDSTGKFERLLVSQCNAGRAEGDDQDWGQAHEDAQKIYDVRSTWWCVRMGDLNAVVL